MEYGDKITSRQLTALIFVSLLSPIIRLLPRAAVAQAGHLAWLSVIPGAAVGLIYILPVTRLFTRRQTPDGLMGLMCRSIGSFGGKLISVLCALWLIVYAGFLARSAAERLLSSVYQSGSPAAFMLVLLAAALLAASGSARSLFRTGELFALMILVVLVLTIVFSLPQAEVKNLLPVTWGDAGRIALGTLPIVDILGLHLYFYFLAGHLKSGENLRSQAVKWFFLSLGAIFAITAVTVGAFSPELALKEQHAFFILIRNIEILDVIERVEALVITLWILTDFALLAAVFMIVGEIFRGVFPSVKRQAFTVPAAVLSGLCSFFIVGSAFTLEHWSDFYVPAVNIFITFLLIPAVLIIGVILRKI